MIKSLSLFIFLFATISVWAQFDWRGHHRLIGSQMMGTPGDDDWEQSFSQVVLNHRSEFLYEKEQHSLELAYELFGEADFYQNKILSRKADGRFLYRIDDGLDYFLINEKQSDDHYLRIIQNLDRFYYTFSNDIFEASLGRQPIAFGSARFINPLDILVPFGFTMVNIEQRLGVDAVRLKYGFSDFGLFEVGGAFDKDLAPEQQYRFISVREKIKALDFQFIMQELKKHKVYGLDLQTDLWNWGLYLNYAWIDDAFEAEDFNRYSLGGQYHFENDLNFTFEYHFNEYSRAQSLARQDLGIFVIGEEYFSLGGGYLLTPLQSLSLGLISNLDDESKLLTASYQYNFLENWYGETGLYYGVGDSGTEFALYPQTLFLALKNFF